jgi:trk system potassium uptake protein TrkH
MKRLKTIMKISSALLYILALLLLIPIIVAWLYKEPTIVYKSFIYTAIFSLIIATIFKIISSNHTARIDLTTAMILCTVAWVLVSLVGAVPFMIGLDKSLIDSLFESVSGFTTTGITVFEGLDSISHGLIFWRSFIQWLGGLGILTFFLFVTTRSESDSWQLFSAEGHKVNSARPVPNVFRTIKYFWAIYAAYTLVEILILWGLGMTSFDAIIHSMTTLSTGGFSNHDASIGFFKLAGYKNYILMEYTIIFFMFLGGLNFLVHYRMIKEDHLFIFKDIEAKTFMKIIIGFSALTIFGIIISRGLPIAEIEETIRKTVFQMVSIITTTGFGTQDIGSDYFPAIAKQLFIVLMIIGGCVGSTSGGIKVFRVVVLGKLLKREVKKIPLPKRAVLPTTVNNIKIGREEILRITAIVFGWILIIIVGAGITALFSDLGPFEAFSGMASAVGNIGPFYFSVSKMASLSWVIKLTYIIGMLAGRLELLPIYIIISKRAWK